MKKSLLTFVIVLLSTHVIFSQNYLWAKNMGGPGYDQSNAILSDAAGNNYITGLFSDVADFDPGLSTYTLAAVGLSDIFIAKYDNTGSFVWAKSIGGTGNEYGYAIQLDAAGNIYITGSFENTVDFDPGVATVNLTSNGSSDIFIAKYDNTGNYVWAQSIGGTGNDIGQAIQADASGNVIVTGYFTGTVDFDPMPTSTVNLVSTGIFIDAYIAKYDNAGNYVFAKQLGGSGNDAGSCLQLDVAGNIYVSGTFQGTADFDPGAGNANLVSGGGSDIFMGKYDNAGNYVWAKNFGGSGDEGSYAFQIDASGNQYITGYFSGTADFDPGAGTSNLTSNGNYDVFVSKCDASGNFAWAKGFGGTGNDAGRALQLDGSGNVYIAGTFTGTVDFDPGTGICTNTAAGQTDIFISKFDNAGNAVRASRLGNNSCSAFVYGLQIDATGNLYLTGRFMGYMDFDVDIINSSYLSSIGNDNIFVAKYDNLPIGINELNRNNNNVTIYPNPNNGQFYISQNNTVDYLKTDVLDITGQIIRSLNFEPGNNMIDLSTLKKGLYFIQLYTGSGLQSTVKICVE